MTPFVTDLTKVYRTSISEVQKRTPTETGLAQLVEHWSPNQVSGVRASQPVQIVSIAMIQYVKEL